MYDESYDESQDGADDYKLDPNDPDFDPVNDAAYIPYFAPHEEKKEGWLQCKSDTKILGKSTWDKYYAVLDADLWSIRFFKSEQDYFNQEIEAGEITLQKLKSVMHLVDKQDGKRFNVVTFHGREFELKTNTNEEAESWVKAVKKYEETPLPRFSATFTGSAPGRRASLNINDNAAVMAAAAEAKALEDIAVASKSSPEVEEMSEEELANLERDGDEQPEEERKFGKHMRRPTFQEILAPLAGPPDSEKKKTKKKAEEEKKKPPATDTRGRRFTDALAPMTNRKVHKSTRKFQLKTGQGTVTCDEVRSKETRTTHITWDFDMEGRHYTVELYHGRVWGKRQITVNGNEVHSSRQILDDGSQHPFEIEGKKFACIIMPKGFSGFDYFLEGGEVAEKLMSRRKLVVIGASGSVGVATVKYLVEKYAITHEIVVGVRNISSNRADPIRSLGAAVTLCACDMNVMESMEYVFEGAHAVFIVTPGSKDRVDLVKTAAATAKNVGIKFVMVVSVPLADLPDTVFGKQFYEIENFIRNLGIQYCLLRCTLFYENELLQAESLRQEGKLYGSISPDTKHASVAVNDVGKAAAEILANSGKHVNKVYKLTSAESMSMNEIAMTFAAAMDKKVEYVQLEPEKYKQVLSQTGLAEWQVEGRLEWGKLVDASSGITNGVSEDYKSIMNEEPTSFESWVQSVHVSISSGEVELKSTSSIVIVGSSGNIGQAMVQIVASRLSRTHNIVVGLTDPSVPKPGLRELGDSVRLQLIDMNKPLTMMSGFKGAHSVFIVTPGSQSGAKLATRACEIARDSGVKFVLVASVLTAELPETVFGKMFHELEENVKALQPLKTCIIRLPLFIDNNLAHQESIVKEQIIYGPQDRNAKFTPVAVQDVGEAAACILSDPMKHSGKTYKLTSPSVNNHDLAEAFSASLGQQIHYRQISYEKARNAFLGKHAPAERVKYEWQVDGLLELFKLIDSGSPVTNDPCGDFQEITGRPAITLQQWCTAVSAIVKPDMEKQMDLKSAGEQAALSQQIVVLGSSGQVGTATIKALVVKYKKRFKIVACIRDPSSPQANPVRAIGADVKIIPCDMRDPEQVKIACANAFSVLVVTPGTEDRADIVIKAARAIAEAGVKSMCVISITSAVLPETIFGRQFHKIEEAVQAVGVPFTIVRLPFFMDNNWAYLETIKSESKFYSPLREDARFCPIALSDVGLACAKILTHPEKHTSQIYQLTTAAHSNKELAAVFSEKLGRKIEYAQVKYDEAEKSFMAMGFPEWQVKGMLELMQYIDGRSFILTTPTKHYKMITNRLPMTIEQWVEENKMAFMGVEEKSDMPNILVIGASGGVGANTSEALLRKGVLTHRIKFGMEDTTHSAGQHLKHLSRQLSDEKIDANIALVDMNKPMLLAAQVKDADIVFIVPPNEQKRAKPVINAMNACKKAGVKFILAVTGTTIDDVNSDLGKEYKEIENHLVGLGVPHCIIRLPLLMDTHKPDLLTAKKESAIYGCQNPESKYCAITYKDAGEATAMVLLNHEKFVNKIFRLTATPFTPNEMAKAFTRSMQKDIVYKQESLGDYRQRLLNCGIPEWAVQGMMDMFRLIEEGSPSTTQMNEDFFTITGRHPESVHDWADRAPSELK